MIGDLVIKDAALISKIKSGVRELSVGYQCQYVDNGNGTLSQTKLAANHIAVVDSGRAGEHVRINDNAATPIGDFYEMTSQYLHQNPSAVAARRKPALDGHVADGVVEEMEHAARPRNWDELAEELTMPKKKTTDDDAICAALERLTEVMRQLASRRSEPEEEESEVEDSPVLHKLRRLKPMIAASKDRAAIDAYNDAIRAVKGLGSSLGSLNLVPVSDRRSEDTAADWEAAVKRARARMLGLPENSEPLLKASAEDATAVSDDEAWGRQVSRLGKEIRAGKLPRKY